MAVIGTVLAAILVGLLYALDGTGMALIPYLLFPAAFAMLSVSLLPIAFTSLEKQHLVLGIGVFFSGVELPSSILKVMLVA